MTAVGGFSALLVTRSLDEDVTQRWEHLDIQVAVAPTGIGVTGQF